MSKDKKQISSLDDVILHNPLHGKFICPGNVVIVRSKVNPTYMFKVIYLTEEENAHFVLGSYEDCGGLQYIAKEWYEVIKTDYSIKFDDLATLILDRIDVKNKESED